MRLAFISDIHGNIPALEAVLEDIKSMNVDQIAVLGDLCLLGPETERVVERIRRLGVPTIKGNSEEWMIRGIEPGEVPDEIIGPFSQEREWVLERISQTNLDYLKTLKTELTFEVGELTIQAFHATPNSLFDVVAPNVDDHLMVEEQMMKSDADIYIYGHIHQPFSRYLSGKCLINCGAVGLPFDGNPQASYALVEVGGEHVTTSIRRISYDVEAVVAICEEVGYPNAEMVSRIVRSGYNR